MVKVHNDVVSMLDAKLNVILVLFDLSAAFDTVNRDRPIYRVTISCLFLRFVLIFKGNVLENVNVLLRNVLIFESRGYF